MAANWIDLVLIIVVVLGISLGTKRGFGRALFDFGAALLALRVTDTAHVRLAESISFTADPSMNIAWSFGITFVIAACLFWFLGKLLYDTIPISLDTFDPPLGAMLGLGIALAVGHAFARTVFLGTVDENGVSQLIQQSTLGWEFYGFSTYQNVIATMKRLGD